MKTWSVPLAIEAALCAGLHTLCAPLLLFAVLAPMAGWGVLVVLAVVAVSAVALFAYWKLAMATIERRAFRFGLVYWSGVAAVVATLGVVASAERWEFWALVLSPPILSGIHFSYLQASKVSRAAHDHTER